MDTRKNGHMMNHFYRDRHRGLIGGVCAGLSDYFGVRPTLLRLVFLLLTLSNGPGVLAYIILWIILPQKGTSEGPGERVIRENVREMRSEARSFGKDVSAFFTATRRPDTAQTNRIILLGGLLVGVGLLFLADSLQLFGWFRLDRLWPVTLILMGIVMLNRALRT